MSRSRASAGLEYLETESEYIEDIGVGSYGIGLRVGDTKIGTFWTIKAHAQVFMPSVSTKLAFSGCSALALGLMSSKLEPAV